MCMSTRDRKNVHSIERDRKMLIALKSLILIYLPVTSILNGKKMHTYFEHIGLQWLLYVENIVNWRSILACRDKLQCIRSKITV